MAETIASAATTPQQVGIDRLANTLSAPVDVASLVVFRIGFGLIAAWWCFDDLRTGRVHELYVVPAFHFTYYLFDFVRPWPGVGMTLHFLALLLLALCVAAGFLYRVATVLFALGFTYFFLLDRTNYQNHYYLLMLVSWTLVLLPLNRCAAVDAFVGLAARSDTVPAWCLWLLRFHIALPYAFGGLSKLRPDWFAGEPLRTHLTSKTWLPLVGPWLTSEVTIVILTWGGLLFDLAIVPLLLWSRTRVLAYVLCLGFHLMNSFLFDIHVFPWFMMFATTLFFAPDWPRRLLGHRHSVPPETPVRNWATLPPRSRVAGIVLSIYCVGHLLIPLRPFLYPGDSAWTERGHHFSWRMMLRSKSSALRYYVTDPKSGKTGSVDLRRFVNLNQGLSLARDPEMILHLAHFIGDEFHRQTGRNAEVRALVLTSLNGRKPELLIDPNVDLAKEPRGFHFRNWILPQHEPLRSVAWSVPMQEWERHVELPPLTHLQPQRPDRPQKPSAQSALGTSRLLPQHTPPRNEVRRS
ncbi:MAG: HTTM domain-containing protein [Planctomycetales bacterium]|nr:HTTM domain-containing protein [Planctomycetales bacterium]